MICHLCGNHRIEHLQFRTHAASRACIDHHISMIRVYQYLCGNGSIHFANTGNKAMISTPLILPS